MQLEIRGRDVDITDRLRDHIERRLGFALGRFAQRIKRVLVCVGELNGPRGDIDKGCRLAITGISDGGSSAHGEAVRR
jgi:putative sigma-54 modulation protein